MSFHENLKKIRKENNLSQEELAEMLHVSRQAVSKWEQGSGYPEVDKLLLLSQELNLSLDTLMSTEIVQNQDSDKHKMTGNITIISPHEHVLANCYKVISSKKFKGKKDNPQYALFAVNDQYSPFWGQSTLFLGWYAHEEDIGKEMIEIKNAIEMGIQTYELKYSVKVERHWMKMRIVHEG